VACLAEEIETPGDGQIRALVTIAGNPVLSIPDGDRLARALDALDFMVSIDLYVNETTRHADVILPVPSAVQRSHYDVAYYQFSVRNVANYSPAVLPLDGGARDEWRTLLAVTGILQGRGPAPDVEAMDTELATLLVALAVHDEFGPIHGRDPDEILRALQPWTGPQRILDLNLRIGPYGDGFGTNPGGLSLARLVAQPHGIDLGPLEPRIPEMLRTPTGRIDLATTAFVADLARLCTRLDEPQPDLVLVGRRHLRSNNSWQHNVRTLMKGTPRCVLQIHPDDAGARGLVDGERVRLSSTVASLESVIEISDTVMPGVVSLPHGWGHDLDGIEMQIAAAQPGVNTNRIIGSERVDPLSGNPHMNGVPVEITRLTP
jgi:anaerobic selenocysteine-containing dehydrogenase